MTSTAYVRRFRHRQREGKLMIRIEVDGPTRDQLVEAKFLGEWDTEDRQAVAEAVLKVLMLLPGNAFQERDAE